MSDHSEIKSILDAQGRAFEEFKTANDALIKAKAEGKAVGDLEAKVATLNAALDNLGEFKAKVEAEFVKLNRPNLETAGDQIAWNKEVKAFNSLLPKGRTVTPETYTGYKSAFDKFLRADGRIESLNDDERKAMYAGSDPAGGYFLPPPSVNSIVEKVRDNSVIRQLADGITISTNAIEGLTDRDDAASGWVGETAARTATNTPTVGKDRIETAEMYAFPQLSQTLIDDAVIDVEGWMNGKVARSFTDLEMAGFATGNGVTQPRGLFSYTTAATADATRTWGVFEHVATGASADFNATNPADYIIDLISKLKMGYLQNASFLMPRAVRAKIRKFKEATTNAYMWQPGLAKGVPDTLFGYPVYLDEFVPALAASSLSMAFGDLKRGYMVVDRQGIRALRDPFTNKPYIGLYVTRRVGGAARDFDAVKFMKFI